MLVPSDAGDILIGDSHGNRFHVAVFANDGGLLAEFECPHVKVIILYGFHHEAMLREGFKKKIYIYINLGFWLNLR